MRGLYAIVDVDALGRRGLDPARFAASVLAAGPAVLQIRDKSSGARKTLDLLRAVAGDAARAGVPLYANDRPDLALAAGCAGVHVGQEDLPAEVVREIAPGLGIGLSTHDAGQVEAALGVEGLAYVAIGPVFATTSKERPDPVLGLDGLAALAARVRKARPGLPIAAIGGISAELAGPVGEIADLVAVISALVPGAGADPYGEATERARALARALAGGPRC